MLGIGVGLHESEAPDVAPTLWLDAAYNRRLPISATNSSGADLHDHLVSVTLPAGVTVDSASLVAVETTTLGSIDHGYDYRYAIGTAVNRLPNLPVMVSGGVVTFKTLGRWISAETRTFHLYWSTSSLPVAPAITHLDAVATTWVAVVTAGTAGDAYTLVVGSATYTYTMIGGDTATIIATALRAAINGGAVATATGSTGTINIVAANKRDVTFTVANTGSTVPANVVVTKPTFWNIGRAGPDTEVFSSGYGIFGVPYGNPGSGVVTRIAFGHSTSEALRFLSYKANGDATSYGIIDGTVNSLAVNGPTLSIVGSGTGSTRAAGQDWSAAYTATYQHRVYLGRKSDDTGARSLNKYVDVVRGTVVYTCIRAYTPPAILSSVTGASGFELLSLCSTANTFGSNVTEAAGNKIANFSASVSTGTITPYAAAADLSGLSVLGSILGTSGNANAHALLINSCTLAGFGTQSPVQHWATQGNAFGILQLVNLSNLSTIPLNATITIDFWYVVGHTNNPTTTGDNLLPDEVVDLIRQIAAVPVVTTSAVAVSPGLTLAPTLAAAASRAVTGVSWFQAQALSKTGLAGNYAFQWDTQNLTVAPPDDNDGNYGQAHILHGLCLRYLRTHDATLVAILEAQVQYHIDIEAAAVAAYGAYWPGSAPYWQWPKPTASGSAYTTEGGLSGGAVATIDPTYDSGGGAGLSLGTISYTQGQVRRFTSIDQLHMVSHGLYAYLYLLRNEAAITANTTLRTNALSLLSRMQTFEAAHWLSQDRVIDNLYLICSTGSITAGTHANGITATLLNSESAAALATPFRGLQFPAWQDANGDNLTMTVSANFTIDTYFRAIWAPDTVQSGLLRFLQGSCYDILAMSLGRHDVTTTQTTWGAASILAGSYPAGWAGRSEATGNVWRYSAGRATDKHYLQFAAGGTGSRDMAGGRIAQRAAILAFTALLDPTTSIPIEMAGASVLRSVDILTALDDTMRVLALYGMEPTTQAQRFGMSMFYGGSGSQIVDSAFTGYWMMAVELWHLVQARVAGTFDPSTYYRFAGV